MSIIPRAASLLNDCCTYLLTKLLENARKKENLRSIATHFFSFPANIDFKIYMNASTQGAIKLSIPVNVISSKEVEYIVPNVLGKLCREAIIEGNVAVEKYIVLESLDNTELLLSPAQVALLSKHIGSVQFPIFPMSKCAYIFLAAIIQFTITEVLKKADNIAKNAGHNSIDCRDVMLAIRNDPDLTLTFKDCGFRDSGIVPLIHKSFIRDDEARMRKLSAFDKVLIAKLQKQSIHSCLIDPRTGNHCYYDEISKTLHSAPFLDAFSGGESSSDKRALLARETLSKKESQQMDKDIRFQSLDSIYIRNLTDIRYMQSTVHLLFFPSTFYELISQLTYQESRRHEITQKTLPTLEIVKTLFTLEAVECLQCYTEDFLIKIFQNAVQNTVDAKRVVMTKTDLKESAIRFGLSELCSDDDESKKKKTSLI